MSITPEFVALIDRLNQEINQTERQATKGLNLVRELLSRFPDNAILIQYFAYLSAVLVFTETSRRQIQAVETLLPVGIPEQLIQETGERLGTLFGQVLETKLRVERFINYLEQ